MRELGLRRGFSAEDAELRRPDPAADTGQDREGPRARLLASVRHGRYRSLVGSDLGTQILRHIRGIGLDDIADRVAVLPTADGATSGEMRDPLPPPLIGLQPPASLVGLVEGLAPGVVRIDCEGVYGDAGGTGVLLDDGLVATAPEVVDGATAIAVLTAAGERYEAELRGADPQAGVALLALPALLDGGVRLAEPDGVMPGDPVVAVARPRVGSERPAVAWGLVTDCRVGAAGAGIDGQNGAAGIRATLYGGEPSAGTPLVGLGGELLGLQCSSAVDERDEGLGQRLVSAASAAAVRKLIEGDVQCVDASRHEVGSRSAPVEVKASAFVEDLTHVENPPALLTHHWKDADTENETERTIPAAEDAAAGDDRFGKNLAATLAFQAPLRVLVHRIDLAAPVNVTELASFSADDIDDSDSEEKVGDLF